MKKIFRTKLGFDLFLFCVFITFIAVLKIWNTYSFSYEKNYEKIQQNVISNELLLGESLNVVSDSLLSDRDFFDVFSEISFGNIGIFIFENDSLRYWNTNEIPIFGVSDSILLRDGFVKLANGYYQSKILVDGDYTVFAFSLFQNLYSYQNEFLRNSFVNASSLYSVVFDKTDYPVVNRDKQVLFYLKKIPLSDSVSVIYQYLIFFLFIVVYGLLVKILISLYRKISWWRKYKKYMLFALMFDVLILRLLIYFSGITSFLDLDIFFDSLLYSGSVLFVSLGDLVFDVFTVLMCATFYYRETKVDYECGVKIPVYKIIISSVISFFAFFIYVLLLKGLILNSSFSLDLSNISRVNDAGIVSLIVLSAAALSVFLIVYRLFTRVFYKNDFSLILVYFITYLLSLSFIVFFYSLYFTLFYSSSLFFILVIYVLTKRKIQVMNLSYSLIYLILFAVLTTLMLMHYVSIRELQERKQYAVQISESRDTMAEFRFQQMYSSLKNDSLILSKISEAYSNPDTEKELIHYLKSEYLSGFWSKYQLQFTICTSETSLDIVNEERFVNCDDYFEDIVTSLGSNTIADNFYFIENKLEEANYLAQIVYQLSDSLVYNLYIDFTPQLSQETLGYPELLIDESSFVNTLNKSYYSYAVYQNTKLVRNAGKYVYSLEAPESLDSSVSFWVEYRNDFSHLYHRVSQNKMVVVSKANNDLLETLAPFSYVLIMFGFFLMVFLVFVRWSFTDFSPSLNFRKRIQTSIILIIVISFFLILTVSIFYLQRLQMDKNIEILNEKAQAVLTELEHKLSDRAHIDSDMEDYLESLLIKFSLVFNSDLNLYELNGDLLASSRSQIFEDGLIASKMNQDAYYYMKSKKKVLFIHEERIGNYSFLSAYVPFRNNNNQIIAYLNLPYFAGQSELTEEIYSFFVAFINVYIVLTVISIFIGLLVSNYITRPLQLMKSQLSLLQLGDNNNKLTWSNDDEIGSLVKAYNDMIDQLEYSANLLAKSERESAWREMAKQVAHEIKNPLTPMKLSVQYLKKAWDDEADNWDQHLDRFTNTMIEQIDSLSSIATAFSDFAKMPKSEHTEVDLVFSIKNAVSIFNKNSGVKISMPDYPLDTFMVRTDAKQIIRVFNNLIKNAIQSVSSDVDALVDIRIHREDGFVVAAIRDNGMGIPEDKQEKIFSPNFTTKTSGMGLGLAIVKNIVVNSGGQIWFESKQNVGTTFYVKLPIYN